MSIQLDQTDEAEEEEVVCGNSDCPRRKTGLAGVRAR